MTIFCSTASPGQRWKQFLPGAASHQSDVLSMNTASSLIRGRWLSSGARRSHLLVDRDHKLRPPFVYDYSSAIAEAVEWLGDRYLLAKPINARPQLPYTRSRSSSSLMHKLI